MYVYFISLAIVGAANLLIKEKARFKRQIVNFAVGRLENPWEVRVNSFETHSKKISHTQCRQTYKLAWIRDP